MLRRLRILISGLRGSGDVSARGASPRPDSERARASPAALPMTRREVGALGEKLAADLLKGKGYEIVERNFRCRQGEIDIIARDGECLVFVEVRARRGSDFGAPEESVTHSKQERLVLLADAYLQTAGSRPPSWRIDVVAVELTSDGRASRLEHIENAIF